MKLQFHWDRQGQFNDQSSCWVRVAQSGASGGFGSIQIHVQWIQPVSPVEVAGLEGRRVVLLWRKQGLPVHQVQLIFLHQDEYKPPLLMQITGTSNSPKGMTAEERSAFDTLVESLQLCYLPANEGDAEQAESA